MTGELIKTLLNSSEPSIRWKIMTGVIGEPASSRKVKALQEAVRKSSRVKKLLARRDKQGRLDAGRDVYCKWQGAHWVLMMLADTGYPAGDKTLYPMRDQVYEHWLQEYFYTEFKAENKKDVYKQDGVPVMQGRARRCGSQQGNALYYLTKLGLADKRAEKLAERLLHWRWPDKGWNCDKDPQASHSSFTETLLPMKGLYAYAIKTGDKKLKKAAIETAEVFLKRKLFKRESNGAIIKNEFTYLHYPLYWHYDILSGLKAMAEMGLIMDPRCNEALDLLESKQLAPGGWPAEKRYYHVTSKVQLGASDVDWGGTGKNRMNEWVTADALTVLKAAGRLKR